MRRVEAAVGAPGMPGALTCILVLLGRILLGDEPDGSSSTFRCERVLQVGVLWFVGVNRECLTVRFG